MNFTIDQWNHFCETMKYSTDKKEKSVISEKFIRTLKKKIYKERTSISKNVYIDKLNDAVNDTIQ